MELHVIYLLCILINLFKLKYYLAGKISFSMHLNSCKTLAMGPLNERESNNQMIVLWSALLTLFEAISIWQS